MRRVKKGFALFLSMALLTTGIQLSPVTVHAKTQKTEVQAVEQQSEEDSSEEQTLSGEAEKESKEEQDTQPKTKEDTVEIPEEETPKEETTPRESEANDITENALEEETTEEEETTTEEPAEESPAGRVRLFAENNLDITYVEQDITSIRYEITVGNSQGEAFLEWNATGASWSGWAKEVALAGDGSYEFTLSFNTETGMKNLGYMNIIEGSAMTVTVDKLVINDTYELQYESAPVLQAGVENSNGISNIWNVAPQERICGDANAYLALDKADGAITLYIPGEKEEEEEGQIVPQPITKIQYQLSLSDVDTETEFTWKAQAGSWAENEQTVTIEKEQKDYTVSLGFNEEVGMKNLGYILPINGSQMSVTVNKIVVNDSYELSYETAPVLQAGVEGSNGLANIWNVAPQEKICGDETAYLALDKSDGVIAFYAATSEKEEEYNRTDVSVKYVQAMGSGWNLGNSFDGFDSDTSKADAGELAWGNPAVTRALIAAVKDKGYDSIRIPLTMYRRYTVNESAAENEIKYVVDADWLSRYKQVVDWAVEEGLYVMINIHHDSWIWLKEWDGDKSSEEYRCYTDLWKQLAEYMAGEPQQVCFETINEPDFSESGKLTAQEKLNEINRGAYEIIRAVEGNEKRMIIMPTLATNHERCTPLYRLIQELKDDYIIATVHYYSEWVYSANLGKTGFDEELWLNNGESYTPRAAADSMMKTITDQFTSHNIGVVIGEYGLLGYDQSEGCLQTGEELKYYEYMNQLARQNNVCLMFWDNGSGISRNDEQHKWKKQVVGEMLENSMEGRSSYATGLDEIYLDKETQTDIEIPLTLNGNTLQGIQGLKQGVEYTYENGVVTLKREYVNEQWKNQKSYGVFLELVMEFSSGADWHEYLIKYAPPTAGRGAGTITSGIKIPFAFNGSKVRRMTAYQNGGRVGPNSSWWSYLQYDGSFSVNYEKEQIELLAAFFQDETVKSGELELSVEFYDGQTMTVKAVIDGNKVTSGTQSNTDTNQNQNNQSSQEESQSQQGSSTVTTQTAAHQPQQQVAVIENILVPQAEVIPITPESATTSEQAGKKKTQAAATQKEEATIDSISGEEASKEEETSQAEEPKKEEVQEEPNQVIIEKPEVPLEIQLTNETQSKSNIWFFVLAGIAATGVAAGAGIILWKKRENINNQ